MDLSVQDIRIRFISSSILSLLFNFVFVAFIYAVTNFSFSFPVWRTYAVLWGFVLLFANSCFTLVIIKQLFIRLKVFDVAYSKNNGFFYALLSYSNLTYFFTSFGLAMCQTWTVLQIISFNTDTDSSAVEGCSLWMMVYGGFIGYLFAMNTVTENLLTLTFDNSTASLFDIFTIIVRKNCLRTVGRIIYFMALCCFVDLFVFSSGLFAHIRLSLLFELYLIGFYIYVSWNFSLILLQNTLTQNLSPKAIDQSNINNSGCRVVSEFLADTSNGLLHHLTLGRLADAVALDELTRAQIFNVTDLNGQVVLWQRVSTACLEKLDIFLDGLHKANKQLTAISPAYIGKLEQRRDVSLLMKPMLFGLQNSSNKNSADPFEITYFTKQVLHFLSNLPGCRMLLHEIPFAPTWRLFSSGGACYLDGVVNSDPTTIHSTGKAARQSGQAVIWCIEIIGCLTLASYTEDNLGSVQHILGRILGTLDEIYEAIELHFKLAGLTLPQAIENGCSADVEFRGIQTASHKDTTELPLEEKAASCYRFASDPSLPWRVHATLRWALFCCLQKFGNHLRTIHMDVKRKKKLEQLWKSLPEASPSV